jgi:hypothetical protein
MPQTDTPQTIDMGASMETEEGLAIIDALNEVSDVQAMAGSTVTFLGEQVATVDASGGGAYEAVEAYRCPRGWFLLLRVPGGPHPPASGEDLEAALAAIEDEDLRNATRRALQRPSPQ